MTLGAQLAGCGSIPELKSHEVYMPDAFADSTARLEGLLAQLMKEKDPVKCDELTDEIQRVINERKRLRSALAIEKRLDPK